MDILDQILENLELERELGTRTVEIDRALLLPPVVEKVPISESIQRVDVPASRPSTSQTEKREESSSQAPQVSPPPHQRTEDVPTGQKPSAPQCDIAFFTGRPLSSAGMEAMEKIFAAIGKIKPGIIICLNEERKAKVCVLLGSDALKKRYPTEKAVRGDWVKGKNAMMTFSPDFIFSHFQEGSPHMTKAKLDMWNDIKSAVAMI